MKTMKSAYFVASLLLAGLPALAQTGTEELKITLGKSVVIDYPEDVSRISTSNPEVLDYVPVSMREILLHAKGLGTATLVVWAKSGQRNFYNVTIEQNLEPVRRLMKDTFPGEDIQVISAKETLSLVGRASSQAVADRAVTLVTPLAKSVINSLVVRPPAVEKQILLRVKFAQLDRGYSKQFGVNILSTGAGNTPGATGTGQFSSARPANVGGTIGAGLAGTTSSFTISDVLNIFAFRPDLNLAAFIKLLQSRSTLQILAEPNLVTSNGKEASFLVGGEFPVPILQGGSNAGAVTVQFREFGIRLTFNPTITANGTLRMYVKPEVSSIDLAHAVSFNGTTIPALATRRVESTIELAAGQSFVIGGLIDDRTTETFSRMPGLASIPLLGTLFKSRDESRQKSELIVIVTPEIVEPLSAADSRLKPDFPFEFLPGELLPGGMPNSNNKSQPAKPAPAADKGKHGK